MGRTLRRIWALDWWLHVLLCLRGRWGGYTLRHALGVEGVGPQAQRFVAVWPEVMGGIET